MIEDEEIEKALDYLRDSSETCAKWTAEKVYLTEYRKVQKAELMKQSNASTAVEREQYAYSHVTYKEMLDTMKEAVYLERKHHFLREAATAKIDAWRTEQSNHRAMGRIG